MTFTAEQIARAEELLMRLLPKFLTRDEVLNNLWFIDPDNDMTRLPSIAAAVHVIRHSGKAPL